MNNEFYYFDGVKFQKVLTIEKLKGIPIDNAIEDYILYGFLNTINTLLTIRKIDKKCFYKVDKVNSLFSILTPRGWDALAVEDMEIRAKGLDLIDTAIVNFNNLINIKVDDTINFNSINLIELSLIDIPNPIVREVLKSGIEDLLSFNKINRDEFKNQENIKIDLSRGD